ncbi:hypothetical protein CDL15_Pgr018583 [Punica granatum]|uniref:Gnk2-homologous domain-containing protein n=1 Tax=Punica granatum TaxID=22663 RepID=A0A218WZ79_PUNGR|nr:hypothetical protein CDL15_Pgr018583 [Punica granatum]
MASFHKITFLATVIMIVLLSVGWGYPDTKRIYFHCSDDSYEINASFNQSLSSILDDLVDQTPKSGFNYYSSSSTDPDNVVAYGHGACNGELTIPDCHICMQQACFQILVDCEQKLGGQVQLKDCRLRYEDYPFVE